MRAAALDQHPHHRVAALPVHFGDAHLDQFMRGEGTLHLGHHRVGEPLAGEDDDRFQAVGARLERLALCRRQCGHETV
jgi:hypothetical protein